MMPILILFLFLVSCDISTGCDDRRAITDGDAILHPQSLPIVVDCGKVSSCSEAVEWWGEEYVTEGSPSDFSVVYDILPPNVYGRTGLTFGDDGTIYSAKIQLSVELAIEPWIEARVIAHEIGHILGLADDGVLCRSVMAPGAIEPLDFVTLTEVDRDALAQSH